MAQIIHIHADAPLKPEHGAACNGCGVCCLAEPCPVGALLTLRLSGPCTALHWDDTGHHYRCGVLAAGDPHRAAPGRWLDATRVRIGQRLISAGQGCDSDAEVESQH
mgnify:CR=1 FL=1|jgi:hypothetical protein